MSTSAGKRITKAQQTEQLMKLLSGGASVRAASEHLGISERQGRRLKDAAVSAIYRESAAATEKVIGQELNTLRMLQQAAMPHALRGNMKAVDAVLSIMDRRAKFLGLYQPEKVSVEFGRVDRVIAQVADIIDGSTEPVVPLRRVTA